MKKIIKKILKEEFNKKHYFKSFKVIDSIIKKHNEDVDNLINGDTYSSSDLYEQIYDDMVGKYGFDSEEANKTIGSYILTHEKVGLNYKENDILIAEPKTYRGDFSQYVSGNQSGHVTSTDNYSVPEATYQIRNHYYDDFIIDDDHTETQDFEIDDVYED
jgi:hypothetical protein